MNENLLERIKRLEVQVETSDKLMQTAADSIELLKGIITVARSSTARADEERAAAHAVLDGAGVPDRLGSLVSRIEALVEERDAEHKRGGYTYLLGKSPPLETEFESGRALLETAEGGGE